MWLRWAWRVRLLWLCNLVGTMRKGGKGGFFFFLLFNGMFRGGMFNGLFVAPWEPTPGSVGAYPLAPWEPTPGSLGA
jgi:hypothetical protein